jgi:hypothetical protein
MVQDPESGKSRLKRKIDPLEFQRLSESIGTGTLSQNFVMNQAVRCQCVGGAA